LFVQSIKKLLASGCSSEGCSFVECSTEASAIDVTFGSSVEGHAEPIHQVDDLGSPVSHLFDGWLVLKEVTAVDRIVEVVPFVVPLLARLIVDAVDAALGTHAVGPLNGCQTQQIDWDAQFCKFHRR